MHSKHFADLLTLAGKAQGLKINLPTQNLDIFTTKFNFDVHRFHVFALQSSRLTCFRPNNLCQMHSKPFADLVTLGGKGQGLKMN